MRASWRSCCPTLRRCSMGHSDHALRTAALLRSYSRLEGLKVNSGRHLGKLHAQWQQQLLSSMRRLKELLLPNLAVQDMDDVLLANASGCAGDPGPVLAGASGPAGHGSRRAAAVPGPLPRQPAQV
jgi:hypothetical protein